MTDQQAVSPDVEQEEMVQAVTLQSVLAKAKAMHQAHQLTSAYVRQKISSRVDALTQEDLEAIDAELNDKLAAHAKKQEKPSTTPKGGSKKGQGRKPKAQKPENQKPGDQEPGDQKPGDPDNKSDASDKEPAK